MLIVFGGLTGVGKTALARAVAERFGAAYLRIDCEANVSKRPAVIGWPIMNSGGRPRTGKRAADV